MNINYWQLDNGQMVPSYNFFTKLIRSELSEEYQIQEIKRYPILACQPNSHLISKFVLIKCKRKIINFFLKHENFTEDRIGITFTYLDHLETVLQKFNLNWKEINRKDPLFILKWM